MRGRHALRSGKVRGEAGGPLGRRERGGAVAASSARCTHHLLVALGLLGELGHVDVVGAGHVAELEQSGGVLKGRRPALLSLKKSSSSP